MFRSHYSDHYPMFYTPNVGHFLLLEALLLTTGQQRLDLFQLDHLTHRHVLTSG